MGQGCVPVRDGQNTGNYLITFDPKVLTFLQTSDMLALRAVVYARPCVHVLFDDFFFNSSSCL